MSYTAATGGASDGMTTTVNGLADLNRMLSDFPAQLQKKVLRGALRAGQKIVLDAARSNLRAHGSVHTQALLKSLRISTKMSGMLATATLKAGNKKAFYAHMVEFGTAAHVITASHARDLSFGGIVRGKVDHPGSQAKPFMRPALDSNWQQAVDAFGSYMKMRLDAEKTAAEFYRSADETDQVIA